MRGAFKSSQVWGHATQYLVCAACRSCCNATESRSCCKATKAECASMMFRYAQEIVLRPGPFIQCSQNTEFVMFSTSRFPTLVLAADA